MLHPMESATPAGITEVSTSGAFGLNNSTKADGVTKPRRINTIKKGARHDKRTHYPGCTDER